MQEVTAYQFWVFLIHVRGCCVNHTTSDDTNISLPVKVPLFVVVSMEIFSLRRAVRQTGLGLFSSAGVRGHILLTLWTDAESASFPSGSRPRWVKSMFILLQLNWTCSVPRMPEIFSLFCFSFYGSRKIECPHFSIWCERHFQLFLCVWWVSDCFACLSAVKLWFCLPAICYCRPTHWLSSKPALSFPPPPPPTPLSPSPPSAHINGKCLFLSGVDLGFIINCLC